MIFAILCMTVLTLKGHSEGVLLWDRATCAPDPEQYLPEGECDNIGRFPWMGVVQHDFMINRQMRFAVTSGLLVHPSYAIAPSEDISKIKRELLTNTTKLVLWYSDTVKVSMEVMDYALHPEYADGLTLASLALLQLNTYGYIGVADLTNPILPICLNMEGTTIFTDLYAIKMTDVKGRIVKEVYKMRYVGDRDCDEFYDQAKLSYPKMKPSSYVCAVAEHQREPCVWDSGVALVTRQSWGYWKLIGFSARGPGCGAPTRFMFMVNYLQWIDHVISVSASIDDQGEDVHKIYFRRLSPMAIMMFKGDVSFKKHQGECGRDDRGRVMFKDLSVLSVNQHFAQAFYTMSVARIAHFTCVMLNIMSMSRSNAAVWLEHHCQRDVTGLAPDHTMGPDFRKLECFVYFKSKAYIEFRIYFSFNAQLEMTLFGRDERPPHVANPFKTSQVTVEWRPTSEFLRYNVFNPFYISMYQL